MPATTVASETSTHTVELTVTDAPPLKVEYVYYDVTGLRITYIDDELTDLVVIGTAEDTGEREEMPTRLSAYEMVQQWIRDEVERHRPSRRRAKWSQACQQDACDRADEDGERMGWMDLHKTLSGLEERHRARHPNAPDICWCGREKRPGEDHSMCYPAMD